MHEIRDMEKLAEAHRPLTAKMLTDAAQFNREIVGYPIPAAPELMSDDRATFRADFMQEELTEFRNAQKAGDLDAAVDAMIDLMYVAAGALNEMGVATQPCWDEVHTANMRKKRGAQTKRPGGQGFDAVKPEGWEAPSHADYLTVTSDDVKTIMALRSGMLSLSYVPKSQRECVAAVNSVKMTYKKGARKLPIDFETRSKHPLPTEQALKSSLLETTGSVNPASMDLGNPRLLIMGHARHGKDTVCELLRDLYGFRFTSSSQFAAERVVFPALQRMWPNQDVPHYASAQECFEDRVNHRKLWYNLITAHNTPDLGRLGREIYEGHDVYCGIRNAREFHTLKNSGAFDVAIWVDASARGMPAEGRDSCTVEPWMADFVLDNGGSPEDLSRNLGALIGNILGVMKD